MSFIATNFVFGDTPSEELGLIISSVSNDGDTNTNGGNDVEPIVKYIYRRPVPYFYGVNQNKVLEFDVEFSSPNEIDSGRASVIQNILFGQMNYQKLRIVQPDMGDIYMNCFLLNPEVRKIGGQIVGFKAKVQCDSPWAWQYGKSKTYTYTPGDAHTDLLTPFEVNDAQIFNNISANNYYMFPKLVITMNSAGGDFSLTNITDASRVFSFTDLSAGEILTVNNDLEMITSSLSLNRLGDFNKKWFRLLAKRNSLTWTGNISSLKIEYVNAVKIGG